MEAVEDEQLTEDDFEGREHLYVDTTSWSDDDQTLLSGDGGMTSLREGSAMPISTRMIVHKEKGRWEEPSAVWPPAPTPNNTSLEQPSLRPEQQPPSPELFVDALRPTAPAVSRDVDYCPSDTTSETFSFVTAAETLRGSDTTSESDEYDVPDYGRPDLLVTPSVAPPIPLKTIIPFPALPHPPPSPSSTSDISTELSPSTAVTTPPTSELGKRSKRRSHVPHLLSSRIESEHEDLPSSTGGEARLAPPLPSTRPTPLARNLSASSSKTVTSRPAKSEGRPRMEVTRSTTTSLTTPKSGQSANAAAAVPGWQKNVKWLGDCPPTVQAKHVPRTALSSTSYFYQPASAPFALPKKLKRAKSAATPKVTTSSESKREPPSPAASSADKPSVRRQSFLSRHRPAHSRSDSITSNGLESSVTNTSGAGSASSQPFAWPRANKQPPEPSILHLARPPGTGPLPPPAELADGRRRTVSSSVFSSESTVPDVARSDVGPSLSRAHSYSVTHTASSFPDQGSSYAMSSMSVPIGAYRPVRDPSKHASLVSAAPGSTTMLALQVSANASASLSRSLFRRKSRVQGTAELPGHLAKSSRAAIRSVSFTTAAPAPLKIKDDYVMVQVFAVGIDLWDQAQVRDMVRRGEGYGFIPGRGFCGKVIETGYGVSRVARGDFVYGLHDLRKVRESRLAIYPVGQVG
jgi:hypothetical protein